MAVKAELLGGTPGSARIRLSGIAGSNSLATMQIRRNQGTDVFLGLDGQWQASPDCWHAIAAADRAVTDGRAEINIGPLLVDPIVRMQTQNVFRLSVRAGEKTVTADLLLSAQHPLLASDARQPVAAAPVAAPTIVEQPKVIGEPVIQVSPPPLTGPTEEDRIGSIQRQPKGRRPLLAGGIVVLLLAAAAGGYYWYTTRDAAPGAPTATEASVTPTNREMLIAFMNGKPDAAAIISKADEMLKAANVDAAVYLYRQGADLGDPKSALQLGLLYDPDGAALAGSTLAKSSDTAAFWYGKAADAGLAEAQRRLGNVLTKAHPVGSGEFDAGIASLKAASQQGDADAAARLKELGQ
jgi:hypothetical protein